MAELQRANTDVDDVKDDVENVPIEINGTNDMICANCHAQGEESGAVGICKDCRFYLCSDCVTIHRKSKDTSDHQIAFFYCATKMAVNKLVRANSFCLDCGHFLCDKCKVDHRGFRIYRNHTFIGGRAAPGVVFDHDGSSHRGLLRSRSMSCPRSRGSSRSNSTRRKSPTDRKSPYLSKMAIDGGLDQKTVEVSVKEPLHKRTLISSTVGRQPLNDASPGKPVSMGDNGRQREAKKVRYEIDQVAYAAQVVGEFPARASVDQRPCHIISSIFLDNDKLVVADQANRNIKLYDNDFQVKGVMAVEKFPVAMCPSNISSSEMFASSGNLICTISAFKTLQLLKTFKTEIRKIEGLATWASGVAALFQNVKSKQDRKGHLEVHLFNSEGRVLYEIVVSSQCSVRLVTPVWYLASARGGSEILLSDTLHNRILSIDVVHWQVGFVLRGREKGGAPGSLAVDVEGNMLVSWYGEVHKVSPTGQDLGVPVSRLPKDAVLSYNPRARRLVVHGAKGNKSNSKFTVYQL
ncbi:hypothetical protein MAR_035617 [Mya arenaria]|uniref:B box-type domain-containing protein n=1 Tax=Mya arenaria TaxID=6604 RepID=A0ABY7ETL5_MYAAR|nr:uncharacterized protein LOC128241541 [Mya arenaria]WAR10541.1 hypothetical protein MAR_035617 [Mya arenaria]